MEVELDYFNASMRCALVIKAGAGAASDIPPT
jgi:hypothetical protein